MVAASKMRKAQDRMRHARPYGEKIRNVAAHISHANPEYRHPFLVDRDTVKRVGIIVITTDKGLCGALNTNLLRAKSRSTSSGKPREEIEVCALGNKGLGFMQRLGAKIVSQAVQLGDRPVMEKLIGPVKVVLDGYTSNRVDRLMLAYNRFINTMKQEPVIEQLLPLSGERLGAPETVWDYIYEPEARAVLDQVLTRYIEALIFQAVAENMASEQSARMVAMKAASDNAGTLIDELTLIYNKNRQAGSPRSFLKSSAALPPFNGRTMAQGQGTIVQSIGAVIDIEFPREEMPNIYDALVLEESGEGGLVEKGLTFEVEQQLGDGVVRCIALGSSDGVRRGMKKSTGRRSRCRWARDARAHHGRARAPDRRERPDQIRRAARDPPERAQVRRALAVG